MNVKRGVVSALRDQELPGQVVNSFLRRNSILDIYPKGYRAALLRYSKVFCIALYISLSSLTVWAQEELDYVPRDELSIAIFHENLTSIRAYIKEDGVGVDEANEFGETPLGEALSTESFKSAKLLIEIGADVNGISYEEFKTPIFHDACISGDLEIIELMIKRGADIKAVDKFGQNAFEAAAMYGHTKICIALNKLGLSTKHKSHVAAGVGNVKALKKYLEGKVDQRTGWKETPLHYACSAGQSEACKFLLSQGADVDARNVLGSSAMHYAAITLDEDKTRKVVDLLLAAGADINAKDKDGLMPLDMAGEIDDYLISKGAKSKEE